MSEHMYQPLSSTGNIRILKIFKSKKPDDPLEGELIERPLDKARPTYEAVSYTWGGQNADHFILLGGKRLPITKNCSELIRNFRNPKFLEATSVRRLWIDSICINQKDNVEKATQIEMMGQIYARSAQVLIWLGPSTPESDRLFELVRRWGNRAWNPFMGSKRKDLEQEKLETELMENPKMILDVISRPWFTRVWTLQEASASSWAVLRCGRQKMLMGSLFTLSDYGFAGATASYHNIPVILESMERLSLHYRARITTNHAMGDHIPTGQPSDLSITETMRDIRKCGAFEPRDRIFALHAICRRVNVVLPLADYKRSVNEVYYTATVKFLQSIPQYLSAIHILLLSTGRDATRVDSHPLPSWVPDYADTVPPWLVVDHKNSAHLSEMPSNFRFSPDNMRLRMPAVVIDGIAEASTRTTWHPDRIMQVGEDIVWETLETKSEQTIRALQDWARIAKQLPFGCFQLAHSMRAAFFATIGAHRGEMNIYEQVRRARTTCPSAEDMLSMEERIANIIGEELTTELFNDAYEQDFEADAKLWWSLLLANDASNEELTMECLPAILENSPADTLLLKKISTRFNASSISARSDEYKILLALSTLFPGITESLLTTCRGNTFFRTDGGYMGAGTSSLQSGDLIVLVGGLFCPVAVRPLGAHEAGYTMIGPVYVHGVMKGELWGKMRKVFQEKAPKLGSPEATIHGVSRYYCDLELV